MKRDEKEGEGGLESMGAQRVIFMRNMAFALSSSFPTAALSK